MTLPDNRPFPDDSPDNSEENSEQADTGTQANDVADDALGRTSDLSEESEHGGRTNPAQIIPDDVPDLVDKMNEMNRSGRIDEGAFDGEPRMDDEDDGEEDEILNEDDD
ncbi:hypothetical protein ACFSUK_23775 [Sphingobium scionense]|jgi:hypothetical protein|uniref:Uncharacterized protein n=1 Tax=Sphingobium scionense TaxID=1404341 RepID=A0A7W6LNS5_9SPHN|nr:hypothetical protein [Sphingobium scionense]MBB4147709.1 hypothetical protein [Sphingobium scionense]